MEQIISFENLSVVPFKVEKLLDVCIEHSINEHSTFYFKALLPVVKKDSYVENSSEGRNVSLIVKGSGGKDVTLFKGMVQDLEVKDVQGSYYIEVHAVSYSYLLDTEKKSRTFQNKKMSYMDLAQQVAADYKDAMVKDVVTGGAAIGQFIVQYNETDWEFLKRLASHFNTGLVNDVHFDRPRCHFGVPNNKKLSLKSFSYGVKHDVGKYLKLSKSGISGLREQDFIYYQTDTDIPANIGDEVQFQGQTLYVYRIKGCIEKGIFIHHLTLTTKKGMTQPYRYHDRIAGCSLNAKIVEIKNDRVKVSIEVDEVSGHSPGELCFFPYSTIYSSQDGSGWYCMPEVGDSVRIYFPDGTEEHSYAISSVHEQVDPSLQQSMGSFASDVESGGAGGSGISSGGGDGGYSGQRDDPSVKSIRNQDGKEIRLTPDGIYIISDGTTITLTDDGGVSIVSDQNIEFKSDKSICLSAEEDVNIMGLTGLDLSCNETASIKMEENVEIIGQEVKSN
ncbi:MAG: phage baseplate assembly protein V [Lachnospiraceae bacterium]|nr:phage baseplate assembly protein V [Lachnospiraceae bacterium]MDE6251954.1 phage baseplate assembly protein V [Lachnospiraceae bacterium]